MMEIIDVSEGVDNVGHVAINGDPAFKDAVFARREEMLKFMRTVKVKQMTTQLTNVVGVTYKVFVKIPVISDE